ncbi:uncharacterized protein LOC108910610 isoform X2 [Anoplophora glabripennis]|uniref:uncharacterized protein LOC108910610 isoform X2 n=1 Tax=Anoplophora glabripennis TaxID=217634 RepID=UPI00087455C8|nr:uncharacterized protein LOC108910610 isoform X2 [Anoplophora glabripennis]
MFYIKENLAKNSPWILSHWKDEKVVSIPTNTLKDIRNYHIVGIDFLYHNYRKQFKGAILNEEEGMNMQLQVAVFLNAMLNYVEPKFLVLIITPDHYIVNWHYHLTIHGGLRVQIITPKTCPEDFDDEHGLALLLSFSNLKLMEYLIDYDFFSVVIDDFNEIASKLIIKKLHGYFNIGLTNRNFYTDPDQKLQWTMLNWSNPGCVGKLGDFYEIDNDNFANFRDNYRHWWFRLTWNFCESFKKMTNEERQEYAKTLSKWALSNNLKNSTNVKPEKSTRKRKQIEIINDDKPSDTTQKEKAKKKSDSVNKNSENQGEMLEEIKEENQTFEEKKKDQSKNSTETNSQSSQGTIIDEVPELERERDPNYVELPSMDENPILNSIIRNLEKSPEPILTQHSTFTYTPIKYNIDEPTCSKAFEEEDVLLSIINDKAPINCALDEEAAFSLQKEELRSQIFSDEPCTSKSFSQENDTQFFQSLIDSDVPIKARVSESLQHRPGRIC